ncbi:MAG: bifunctional nuclease family protein [Myxococcota bacterium]|nr:bifunctional nuclease family protein [Myxococcota bacterium]
MTERVTFIDFVVRGIALDGKKKTPILLLQDRRERLLLPIWIGAAEAGAIYCALEGKTLSRPMTHDLLLNLCASTAVTILGLDVRSLEGGTFHAVLRLQKSDGTPFEMDCRPSDGIALALRAKRPIRVAKDVLSAAQPIEQSEESSKLLPFVSCDDDLGLQRLADRLATMGPDDFGEFEM